MFLVRKGNPKHIQDWPDLLRPGISAITLNPKTSSGARWNFLVALTSAERRPGATAASVAAYMRDLFRHVPILDIGARGVTNSFVQRELDDVLLAWENEAWLSRKAIAADTFEIIYPSLSILAEPPATVVAQRRGSQMHAHRGDHLPAIPLHEARTDNHSQKLLPPAQSGGGRAIRGTLSPFEDHAPVEDHDYPEFPRLGCGASETLRQQWHV